MEGSGMTPAKFLAPMLWSIRFESLARLKKKYLHLMCKTCVIFLSGLPKMPSSYNSSVSI